MQIALLPGLAEAFMIAFARVGALVMLLPGLGERALPVRQRLAVAVMLTLLVLPGVREALAAQPGWAVGRLMAEMMIGLSLGLAARLALAAMEVAGPLISQTLGLSMAMVLDPLRGQQGDVITGLLRMLGVVLIFATDLHHVALAGIVGSYEALPVGAAPGSADLLALVVRLTGEVFHMGLKIAAPFLVFGLVFNFGLGLASKLAPQLQLFFLAMPAAILLGLGALVLVLGLTGQQFTQFMGAVLALLFPGVR